MGGWKISLHIFFILVFVIALSLLVQLWINSNYSQNARKQLKNEYGKFPERLSLDSEDYVAISRLYSMLKHEIPEDELIDQITWDDLDMDDVFQLINCTKSFIGEVDLSIAIGSFRQCLDHYCIPVFSEKSLTATGIYHLLVDNAVANDFSMTKNVIITGSNASGKSTFIKAVAINLILGQNINTCTATNMTIPNVIILTSIAVRDDISSGESYYIKEVKYLKRMIEYSNQNRMVFCGIDEILRGTNTLERIAASISILEYLLSKNCMLMVASHDLELAHSLDGRYENFYFCESIEGQDVVFNYKLCAGISHTNNAIRLLESMGFPEEIVLKAKKRKFIENKLYT